MRFRLRTLLLTVTLTTACVAWLTYRANQNRRQRHAIAQVSIFGGRVAYKDERQFEPAQPANTWADLSCWLRDAIHPRVARQIMFANSAPHRTSLSDDNIETVSAAIGDLPTVTKVTIMNADITRHGVYRLRQLLPHIRITAWGVRPDRELTDLERLNRELWHIRDHYQRLGYDEPRIRQEIAEFRDIWFTLRGLSQQQSKPRPLISG